jgi:hypothetical protein
MSTDVSEVRATSIFRALRLIALMMGAARTSEMSVDIQLRTRQYIPEDSELHTRCRENLKSHMQNCCLKGSMRHEKNLLSSPASIDSHMI